jgi:hypothetical protein
VCTRGDSIDRVTTDGAALSDSTRLAIDGRRPRPSGKEEDLPLKSRRKPLAALAAVTAALALAVPAASASAATTAPAVRTASIGIGGGFDLGSLYCRSLVGQLQAATLSGNTAWVSFLGYALFYGGCGGAAI